PAGQLLVELAGQGFRGTATELLQTLNQRADESTTRQRGWLGSAKAMAALARRIAPNLRELGYQVESSREPGGVRRRIIEIGPLADRTVPTVPTVPDSPSASDPRDDRDKSRDASSGDHPGTTTSTPD